MSVQEIIREIKSLPTDERWQVLESVRHMLEPEIPESFKEGMAQIKRGEMINLDDALQELDAK